MKMEAEAREREGLAMSRLRKVMEVTHHTGGVRENILFYVIFSSRSSLPPHERPFDVHSRSDLKRR